VYKKLKNYAEVQLIPIVTEEWINLCYEYTYKFSYEYFKVEKYGKSVIFDEEECDKITLRTLEDGIDTLQKSKKAPMKVE
jgi:hypothetical protein